MSALVPSDIEAAAWDDTYRQPGTEPGSRVCAVCGQQIPAADLLLHLHTERQGRS